MFSDFQGVAKIECVYESKKKSKYSNGVYFWWGII